jgi:mxaJ protein
MKTLATAVIQALGPLLGLMLASAAPPTAAADAPTELRVCADPDNLPFSHADGSGFENRIARLLADEMELPLRTFWLPQRRGFVRKTLGAQECDVIPGVPTGFERVLPTRPYYRSTYVFVNRADEAKPLMTFDDPRLASMRIGVQLVGNDLAATPPGHALTRRGATQKVVGFTVFGDGPAAERMAQALARHEIDAALVWGPQAGYFAQRSPVPMSVARAAAPADLAMPFEFGISMGVRRGDKALRDRLDEALARKRPQIDAILAEYGVPRTDGPGVAP